MFHFWKSTDFYELNTGHERVKNSSIAEIIAIIKIKIKLISWRFYRISAEPRSLIKKSELLKSQIFPRKKIWSVPFSLNLQTHTFAKYELQHKKHFPEMALQKFGDHHNENKRTLFQNNTVLNNCSILPVWFENWTELIASTSNPKT